MNPQLKHVSLSSCKRLPSPGLLTTSFGKNRRYSCVAAVKQQFSSFDDMIQASDMPVLVDFYAHWCGPCQMITPVLSSISQKLKGSLKVVKIDHDKYPLIASKYRVHALPTLLLFKSGEVVTRIEGVPDEKQLYEQLCYFLGVGTLAR